MPGMYCLQIYNIGSL